VASWLATVPIAEPSACERNPSDVLPRAYRICPVRWRSRDRGVLRHALFDLL